VRPAVLAVLLALLVAACGGERTFEPGEFVDAANEEGAGLVLGEQLTSIEEGVDVYALSFTGEATAPATGEDEHGHGTGGSMIVTDDAETAMAEFERCESAVSLTCYRASNVVLYFNAAPTDEHVVPVEAAIRALGNQ
jgi:hypothetical protein